MDLAPWWFVISDCELILVGFPIWRSLISNGDKNVLQSISWLLLWEPRAFSCPRKGE